MLKYVMLFLMIAGSTFIDAAEADNQPLRMVISNWAPYKGENLPDGGVASDITRQVLTRIGYSVETKNLPWKRALVRTMEGAYDVIPAIWSTPEREVSLHFSDPILKSRIVVISLESYNFEFNHLEDLRGKTVGVGRGWGYPDDFITADYFKREPAKDLETNMKKLINGRFNIIVGEELAARHLVNTKFKDKKNFFRFSSVSIKEAPLLVAFSRALPNYEKITVQFNEALKAMHEDGSYKRMLEKHGVSKSVSE